MWSPSSLSDHDIYIVGTLHLLSLIQLKIVKEDDLYHVLNNSKYSKFISHNNNLTKVWDGV